LTQLAARLEAGPGGHDAAKVGTLVDVVKQLAAAPRVARGE
jgi:hypothetical protein